MEVLLYLMPAGFGGILLLISAFILGAVRTKARDGDPQDLVTRSLRSDFRNNQPNIVTLNGVYALNMPWGALELGSRIGEVGSQFGL